MAALLDAMARLGREDGARVVPAAEDDGAVFSMEECKKAHYALPYFHGLRRESLGCLEMSSQPLEQSLVHQFSKSCSLARPRHMYSTHSSLIVYS